MLLRRANCLVDRSVSLNSFSQRASAWPFLVGFIRQNVRRKLLKKMPKRHEHTEQQTGLCTDKMFLIVGIVNYKNIRFLWDTRFEKMRRWRTNCMDKHIGSFDQLCRPTVEWKFWLMNFFKIRNAQRNFAELKELKNIRKANNCMVDRSVLVHTVSKSKWWCIAAFSFTFWWTKNMSSGGIPEFNEKVVGKTSILHSSLNV